MISATYFCYRNWKILTKKRLFPKFQLVPLFRLQVMHDYVHWYCAIDYCVRKFSDTRIYWKIALISPWNDFCSIPLGKCIFKGRATNRRKKFKFLFFLWNIKIKILIFFFESALYLKSGSMPLINSPQYLMNVNCRGN